MVEFEDYRIKDASEMLNLNYSTAKSIIRMFRLTGMVNRKNERPNFQPFFSPFTNQLYYPQNGNTNTSTPLNEFLSNDHRS